MRSLLSHVLKIYCNKCWIVKETVKAVKSCVLKEWNSYPRISRLMSTVALLDCKFVKFKSFSSDMSLWFQGVPVCCKYLQWFFCFVFGRQSYKTWVKRYRDTISLGKAKCYIFFPCLISSSADRLSYALLWGGGVGTGSDKLPHGPQK